MVGQVGHHSFQRHGAGQQAAQVREVFRSGGSAIKRRADLPEVMRIAFLLHGRQVVVDVEAIADQHALVAAQQCLGLGLGP